MVWRIYDLSFSESSSSDKMLGIALLKLTPQYLEREF